MTRLLGGLLLAGALLLLGRGSGWPVRWHPADAARLRIAIGARPERLEHCRTLDAAELAARPAHMRQAVVCEGRTATYHLQVSVDGAPAIDGALHGGGLRQDRLVSVLEEVPLTPGRHRVTAVLTRREAADSSANTPGSAERRARQAPLPPNLTFEQEVEARPSRVVILTYDPEARRLQLLPERPAPE